MASIFTKIITREIPGHLVAEDDSNIAFLDINPVAPGHTLIVPKKEVDYLFDLEEDEYISLNIFARKVAKALKKAVPCKRIGTAVVGLEVPHTHIHLIPLNSMADFSFAKKLNPSREELVAVAGKISEVYQAL